MRVVLVSPSNLDNIGCPVYWGVLLSGGPVIRGAILSHGSGSLLDIVNQRFFRDKVTNDGF